MPEQYASRSHPEPVVLEIGDDLGALVVYTTADLHGAEIEISPTGRDDARSHKDVLNRPINGRPTYTAVFDKLTEGSYTLWTAGVAVAEDVTIAGASITELDWRAATPVGVVRSHHPAGHTH
jgi:hypothetical protein